MSVHLALGDVWAEMGPTFFCPCTHAIPNERHGGLLAAAALKHGGHSIGSVDERRCIGHGYSLQNTPGSIAAKPSLRPTQ